MPYKNESMLMGMDASADTSTELCFNPPNGPFDASNVVKGTIGPGDEDWIIIELSEGNEYTITVGGDTTGTTAEPKLNDSVLKLMDSKGGLITMNDDVDGPMGDLGSKITFTPEAGSGTQKYYISVSGYSGNPGAVNTGAYTVSVKEVALPPPGEGVDIPGTDNDDKLFGTDDSESISGEKGDDSLFGAGGDDSLDGGAGNDLLVGGPGADMLDGGANGDMGDTISYMDSEMGVRINLRAGTASGGDAEGDEIEGIENVRGSMYDDMLSGSREDNMIWGLDGNDELYGDRGMDTLDGGDGNDELDGGDGNDTLKGGMGADELTGSGGDDTASYAGSMMGVTVRLHARQAMGGDAEGDTWGDTVTVEYDNPDPEAEDKVLEETVPDIVHLTGSGMADILAGDSRNNIIKGMGGDDKLYGGPGGGDDMLHGGMGDDMLFGGHGADELKGGGGDDTLVGGSGNDTYYGGDGSDMIYADSADANIDGWIPVADRPEEDANTTELESSEDHNDPGAVDTVSYARLEEGVGTSATERLSLGVDTATTGIRNVENLIGTPENDFLGGNAEDNVIEGGDGADNIDAGDGYDTVSYRNSDRGVTINLSATPNTASGGHAQGDTILNFENVIGSAHDDVLIGNDTDYTTPTALGGGTRGNMLMGLAGDDELIGGEGSDTIEGGAGADEMDGGTSGSLTNGNDEDNDTLSYASSDAGVHVNLTALTFAGGHAEGDEVEVQRDAFDPDGAAGSLDPVDVATFESLIGSMYNDRLTGDHRDNRLTGGAGDDTLKGGASDRGDGSAAQIQGDVLIGGPGADMLDGGEDAQEKDNQVPDPTDTDPSDGTTMIDASVDVASYAGAMAGVTVNLATGRGTAGDAMGDTLVNIEKVLGSDHDDTFIAGPGPDNVDGSGNPDMMPAGDTVSYELSDEAVQVTLGAAGVATIQAAQDDSDSYATGDTLANIENVTGSGQDDEVTGNDQANKLMGGDGDDKMAGLAGDDTLMGGDGNDMLGAVDVNGDGTDETEAGNDKLMGGAGRDTLNGGDGNDMLYGGAGDDEMNGGAADAAAGTGADIFVFSPDDGDGDDIIADAITTTGADKIDLSAFGLDAEDLIPLISVRGNTVRIDLRSVGGGTIELSGADGLDDVGTINSDGELTALSEWMDDAGDTDAETDDNGMVDAGEAGIFIL